MNANGDTNTPRRGAPSSDGRSPDATPPIAAIDIGTNSLHLVIARIREGGGFEIVSREKEMVRLGAGSRAMKQLETTAMDRGIAALDRFRRMADAIGAPITAVATSAVREATNRSEFLGRARDEAGIAIEVVSGIEEARLIRLGVLQALPLYDRRHLIIDIGGGSTEIVLGHRDDEIFIRSLRLGAVRLTQRFIRGEQTSRDEINALRKFVRGALAPARRALASSEIAITAGSAGTIGAVASMVAASRDPKKPSNAQNGFEFSAREISKVTERVSRAKTTEERAKIRGLDEKRADIIVAGAVLLDEIVDQLEIESLLLSDFGLREGILLDAHERLHGSTRHHLHDVRQRSVQRLLKLCDDDPRHSEEGARLALLLFDALAAEHGLGDAEREILEAAALLANVGLVISHDQHHRHSYYVIRHSDHLMGFTDHEIEIIAVIARYHRKSAPRAKHPEFAALEDEDRRIVRALAGLLRIAVALNRTRTPVVANLTCRSGGPALVLEVEGRADADLTLALYTAEDRKELLEEVLERKLEFRAA